MEKQLPLEFKDSLFLNDKNELGIDNHLAGRNFIRIYDKDGNLVCEDTNLVVEYGRQNVLERIFNNFSLSQSQGIDFSNIAKQWISVFSVGSGGCPPSEIFNPYLVKPETESLSIPIRFTNELVANVDGNINKPRYWDNNYKKDFTYITMEHDKINDKIYAIIVLELDFSECLGKPINEIGLWFAEHELDANGSIINKKNFRLFSKVNFNTQPKSLSPLDGYYKFIYRVYA